MKRSVAVKWVEALRSGKYKQGREHLRASTRYCCLGVLCDLSEQGEWRADGYMGHTGTLPPRVRSWAGMQSSRGSFPPELCVGWLEEFREVPSLVMLNDCLVGFPAIADFIEQNWEHL